MKRTMGIFGLAITLALAGGAALLAQGDIPRAETVVKPRVLVSLSPVPRGREVEIAIVAEILPGFHVNSNTPREEYLIPTTILAETPAGIMQFPVSYPKGKVQKFEFSETPLDVYEGTFIIRIKLKVGNEVPVGPLKIPMTLRYQACNDRACLRPVKLPLVADLQIAEAGAKATAQHPNVFSAK